ncbi:hypothetical protein GOP47_0019501, partial [Adiantum capillus-veneris]
LDNGQIPYHDCFLRRRNSGCRFSNAACKFGKLVAGASCILVQRGAGGKSQVP